MPHGQAEPARLRGRRVLITGGLGFIGSNLALACVRDGASVTVYDSLDPACGGDLANVEEFSGDIRLIREDIRSRPALVEAMKGMDLVVNCAAYTSHAGSISDPLGYVDVNCVGLVNLLDAARGSGRPHVVQIGTSTQVGRATAEPVTEEHPEFPLDVYSATKTAAEKIALAYGAAHQIPVSVVRLSNVYGPRAKVTDRGLGFVNYFVGLALQDRDLTVFGDGSQRRTLSFVDDVVDAIVRVAVSDDCVGEVFFAASERHHSIADVSKAIVAAVGRGRVRHVEWPADRAAIEVGDAIIASDKIRRFVGWHASIGLEDGMARTAAYFLPRPERYAA